MLTILLLSYDGAMAGAIGASADLFSTANYVTALKNPDTGAEPVFSVRTASVDGKAVTCGSGQVLLPEISIDDVVAADVVIVPGLLANSELMLQSKLQGLRKFSSFLQRMHGQGSILAAGCTGVFILAEAGLLDCQTATTPWWLSGVFRNRYPKVTVDEGRLIVESGQVVTAAAGTSYLDLSLLMIGKFAGPNIARQCAAYLCLDGPRESQNAYAIPHHRQSRDPFIEKADEWIRENAGQLISVTMLAQYLNVSARTLVRRFKATIGQTPADYIQQVRMDNAKYLLQNTRLAVAQIAGQVGYQDEDAFRRAFKKQSCFTPAEFRRRSNVF